MLVRDIMSGDLAACTPDTPLAEVAALMVRHECGSIPVLDAGGAPLGIVTDRDITCRAVAQGKNPLEMTAAQVMSAPLLTVTPQTRVADLVTLMGAKQVRRVAVADYDGRCCAMVTQADIARHGADELVAELLRDLSQPTGSASQVARHVKV